MTTNSANAPSLPIAPITRSPTRKRDVLGPTASMTPAISAPKMIGNGSGKALFTFPSRTFQSIPLIPAACTRTRT